VQDLPEAHGASGTRFPVASQVATLSPLQWIELGAQLPTHFPITHAWSLHADTTLCQADPFLMHTTGCCPSQADSPGSHGVHLLLHADWAPLGRHETKPIVQ
jgi:hypothetical protein